MDGGTLTIDNIHSTPKTATTDKKSLLKTPNRTKPPLYNTHGWTMNRHDKKMYSATGESRVMTSRGVEGISTPAQTVAKQTRETRTKTSPTRKKNKIQI